MANTASELDEAYFRQRPRRSRAGPHCRARSQRATALESPPEQRFPTNWELSTARATNVVRFLEDRGKLPGSRLVAAGFSQFRPAASNASEQTRQQNRRIELVLLPAPRDPS